MAVWQRRDERFLADGRRHRRQPRSARFQRTWNRRGEPPLHPWRPRPDAALECCSKLYAHAAAEAERRGFKRIITYIRADEAGTSLRASGWVCDGPAGGRGWHSRRRARSNRNAWIAKERWSRALRPKPAVGARLKSHLGTDHSWLAAPRSSLGGIAL
ncbi:XF1762 family protein [Lichenicola cladoniae]|uniref:XF1762 family protein n=1 Tax=Lichenicola cladoniae TaxID=1484109 RepID=UPI0038CFA60F